MSPLVCIGEEQCWQFGYFKTTLPDDATKQFDHLQGNQQCP